MKKILSLILILSIFLSIAIHIFAASEDGTWYDTAFTITDFYNIPVENCTDEYVYTFVAPATAVYTIISVSDYDVNIQLEEEDGDVIAAYGNYSDEKKDAELTAELTKGDIYYIWTSVDGSYDSVSYTMQISYEMTSGYYTYDAYTNNCVITGYSGSASSVTIPSTLGGMTVTGIDGDVFYQNTTLMSVTIPGTIEMIGSDCFYGCTSLTNVTFNEGLIYIGAAAFEGCTSLTFLSIPSTVKEIYTSAFEGCSGLTQVEFTEGLEYIKASAFRDCSALTSISLPSTLYRLGGYAFRGCSALSNVDIADGLQIVDNYVFAYCSGLTEVMFPESLLEIGSYVFRNCTALNYVTFLNSETIFNSGSDIFRNCSNVTLCGSSGSTTQIYAETYSIPFEAFALPDTELTDPGFESAQQLTESGETISLNFDGECQYYMFEQFYDEEFSVDLVSESDHDIKYEFYDSEYTLLEEFTVTANQSYGSMYNQLPQGVYYVKVYPVNSTTASCTMCLTFSNTVKPDMELTDPGFESAEELHISGEIIDLSFNGTVKYYTFFLQGDMDFGAELVSTSSSAIKFELYDSQYSLVGEYTVQANLSYSIGYHPLEWGTYYVKVYPLDTADATGTLCITSLAIEPIMKDSGFSSAFHITDTDVSYIFEGLYEYIYFSFDMTETGVAEIYIDNTSEGNIIYELYQGRETVLFRYDMSGGANYTYSPKLSAGRYYIRIYTPWNHAISGELGLYSNVLGDGTVPDIPENGSELSTKLRVYEPTYEYIRQFKDNYATVYNNGVYSLVDAQNNHHYSTNQDGFGDYSEEIVAIYSADKHEITFTRLDGYSFAFIGYIWAGEFLGGKCVIVDEDGKYGLIDTSGNFIIDCAYDDIEYDMSDTVLLYSDSVWTPYTIGQSSTYSLYSRSAVTGIYNPVLSVTGEHIIASDGTAYGILTTDNIPLTAFEYDLIHDAEDGLFVGYREEYVDLIEADGTVSATFTAYYVGGYSEGKFAVYDGTEFFYADKNGNRVVELSVEDVVSAEEFHESLAVVRIENKGYTYINTSGEIAVDSYWDYAAQFAEGYALVMNYITDGDGNMLRRWNVIDTEFNNVLTLEDDVYIDAADEHSADFSNGYIRTVDRNTGLMGFVQLESAASENITGDLNEDGTVSVKDVQYFLAYLTSPEEYPLNAADVDYNGDGEVNRADALYLLRHTILPERYPLSR